MKKFLVSAAAVVLFSGVSFAQALPTPLKDALKKADKARKEFESDNKKVDKIKEALTQIDVVLSAPERQTAEVWLVKGKIYNAMGAADKAAYQAEALKAQIANKPAPTADLKYAGEPVKAIECFKNAIAKSVKKEAKDAMDELYFTQDYINLNANTYNQKNDYVKAVDHFKAVLDIHKILSEKKSKSILDDPKAYGGQLYMVGAMSTTGYANKVKENLEVYKMMLDAKADTLGFVYSSLYEGYIESNPTEALKYLDMGRKKLPLDNNLVIMELNYYLKSGKLNELIDKLKAAAAADPKNVNLVFNLGNAYDQLAQKETDAAKKTALEAEAMTYYNKTLEMDSKNAEALYSIGANFYNKAAALTKELNEIANLKPSKENNAKYDAKNAEMKAAFERALPYFKKAEIANPNDKNTLIALKEIFAQLDKLDLSGEMKKRLLNLDEGKKNTSYFEGK